MVINNPFLITSDYVSAAYFCDREAETKMMIENILNGRNTVLISPRRMGKSGLIGHVFNTRAIKAAYRTFSIDLYAASSLSEMVLFLGKAITDSLKTGGKKRMDTFISLAKSLRPGMKLDTLSGQMKFDLSLGEIERPKDSLEEIFAYLDQSDKPCLVAIDEFQQIAEFPEENVLELLRTRVQKCKNALFIFSGSKRRMMERLFNDPSNPFYMSCEPLYLDPIDRDKYRQFACNHFLKESKTLDDACFNWTYDLLEGHTWYVQRMLNELFARTAAGKAATCETAAGALDHIIKAGSRAYEEQFSAIPSAQKQLLIAIAREGKAEHVTSMAFVKKHALKSPSTVQSALRILYDKEIVTKEHDSYFITNRFFAFWIRSRYVG